MRPVYDIAILGSGFAGSFMAMVARRLGYSVVLLEKGQHPRVVIGESSTPLSNLILEDLSRAYDLPKLRPLTKWGPWIAAYPDVSCGLKRGFSFLHHELGAPETHAWTAERQLLVAASPRDAIADTHWYRADTDALLVQQAEELGIDYIDQADIQSCNRRHDTWDIVFLKHNAPVEIGSRFVIDGTGPRGVLYRLLDLGETQIDKYPCTCGLYSHFRGVDRVAETIPWNSNDAPYPIDDAAFHHVFDGGWMWVLRFDNGWTSAGVAATERIGRQYKFEDGAGAWERLLRALPDVARQFRNATFQAPFRFLPRMAFLSGQISGPGWALLPSTAGFVDPLFSTGFSLTLLGIHRLAKVLERGLSDVAISEGLKTYARSTEAEVVATATLIGALYNNMDNFSLFRSLSLLYFTAASYVETARRLKKRELSTSFLLHDDPVFGPESRRILSASRARLTEKQSAQLVESIYTLIKPFDVAGLSKRTTSHCYPVDACDLFASRHKLGASKEEIAAMLEQSGFYASTSTPIS